MSKQYACVCWTADDIRTLQPIWTEQQCCDWLQDNQRRISDRLVELGWEVIESLLTQEAHQ